LNEAIHESEIEQLLNFIGYGRLDADIWFLGQQETTAGETDISRRLLIQQVADAQEAQEILGISPSQFGEENLQGAWRGMCEIMLRLAGQDPSSDNLQKYFSESLGRSHGSTLVCDLFPLPLPVNSPWNYAALSPQFVNPSAYYEAVKPLRLELFRQLIADNLPKIIIAYGRTAWPQYQELFNDFNLSQNGSFMLGWDANTVIILSDNFSSETMDGNYEELLGLILENSLSIETAKPTGPIPLSKAELARLKKESAKQAAAARRKPTTRHNPADPYCVCAYCLGYENE
jgi:hypothetical protein